MADSNIHGLPVLTGAGTDTAADEVPVWDNSAGTAKRQTIVENAVAIAAALGTGVIANTALTTNPLARANHTGTQLMATISDAGALATKSAVASADITDGTIVNIDINAAAGIALSKLATDPLARANHTGTQSADTLTDGTTNKAFLATERTKLAGIATGATANAADATLEARANHTGTQLAATISDFDTQVATTALLKSTATTKGDLYVATASGTVTRLAKGTDTFVLTADSAQTTGLAWSAPSAGGGVASGLGSSRVGDYVQTFGASNKGSHSTSADRMELSPILIGRACGLDRIAFRIQTTAGSTGSVVRLGIYASGSDGAPTGAPLLDTTAAGTATGVIEVTISTSISAAGVYWCGLVSQGGPVTTPTVAAVGDALLGPYASDIANSPSGCFTQSSVSGALPSIGTLALANNPPMFRLRIS